MAKNEIIELVAERVRGFTTLGTLHLPPNYSAENALKSAWLELQSAKTTDKKPVLTACTQESISVALLSMVVQGLSPAKKQCYFIPYGSALTLQRSYFGAIAVVKMVNPLVTDIPAEVIYEGDGLEYEIIRARKIVTKHTQKMGDINSEKIIGAYALVLAGDIVLTGELMTLAEIHQSWGQSRQKPFTDSGGLRADSTHAKFPGEMAKRTVDRKSVV